MYLVNVSCKCILAELMQALVSNKVPGIRYIPNASVFAEITALVSIRIQRVVQIG